MIVNNPHNQSQLTAICAFGMFAKDNKANNIDFDEIDNELKLLSKQSKQHILDEWDFGNE